jgi:copper chaperone NosL
MKNISSRSRHLLWISAAILIIVFFVPFWQIQMWAPQYPEWLTMKIWLHKLSGDIEIINGLNHYIGMKYIKVEMFPEFKIMPYILGGIILLGFLSAIIAKRYMLWIYFLVLTGAGAAGLIDFYLWGYDYGHNLDPTAAIIVPGMAYQPPLIGTKELLNFIAFSAPDIGGWIMLSSGLMVILVLFLEYFKKKSS